MERNRDGFLLGVNYWPAKSGVRMWREFDPEGIDRDFAKMRELGMDCVRIFPLWMDFQPIRVFSSAGNTLRSVALETDWNASEKTNPAMLDPVMVGRLDETLRIAEKHGLRVIVALLTAWMSGTLFNPAWKDGKNVFSDSFLLKWQMLFCRKIAEKFRGRREILAWEYGNEQNCVDSCESSESAWVWLHALAGAFRTGDPEKEVFSGMHGLGRGRGSVWKIADQSGAVDCLTTHPYPLFTPGCFRESPLSFRASLHPSAESLYYQAYSGLPVLCEETGNLGDCVLSEDSAADFLRMRLYSLFFHGVRGCLWWCYSDFSCGGQLPYRDVQMENNGLGLVRTGNLPKPSALEYPKFRKFLETFGRNPGFVRKKPLAAIVSGDLSDDWESAFTAFALCKQAGIDVCFADPETADFTEYRLLIAPSWSDFAPASAPVWERLRAAVHAGSVLYLSGDAVHLTGMNELFGISEQALLPADKPLTALFQGGFRETCSSAVFNTILKSSGTVLAASPEGVPVVTESIYGKGVAVFSALPFEKELSGRPRALETSQVYRFYRMLGELSKTIPEFDLPGVEIERIPLENNKLAILNHSSSPLENLPFTESSGTEKLLWSSDSGAVVGNGGITLKPYHAAVVARN